MPLVFGKWAAKVSCMSKSNELSEDRTIMANERTFSSWTGGGMGAIGLALAFKAVFGAFEPVWFAKLISTIPLVAALFLFWSAQKKACATLDRLTERRVEATGKRSYKVVSSLLSLTAIGAAIILWAL